MKKNLFKAMIPTIAMILVALMSITGITYAWFTASDTATISSVSFDVEDISSSIKISTTGIAGSFESSITGLVGSELHDVSTVDSLTNGAYVFYEATAFDGEDPTAYTAVTSNTNNAKYFVQQLYVMNEGTDAVNVSLQGTSVSVASGAGTPTDSSAAARIGIVKKAYCNVNVLGNAAPTTTTVSEYTEHGILNPASGTTEAYNGVNGTTASDVAAVSTKADTATFFTIQGKQVVVIDVYVWLEGQDDQCKNTITGQSFTADIVFKAATQTPAVGG